MAQLLHVFHGERRQSLINDGNESGATGADPLKGTAALPYSGVLLPQRLVAGSTEPRQEVQA